MKMKTVYLFIVVFLSGMAQVSVLAQQKSRLETQLDAAKEKAAKLNVRPVEQNVELNKIISLQSDELAVLKDQISDLKNKIKMTLAEDVNGYAQAGNAYMQCSLYDKAIENYDKAASIDPNDAEIQLRLGFLYKQAQDEPKEAVYHFKKYLSLQPNAKNRKEVEYLIKMLSNNSNSDWSN